jgi:hypothetical protein
MDLSKSSLSTRRNQSYHQTKAPKEHYCHCHILPAFPWPSNPKQSQDPATPGSPCSKPRCWLVIDWTLINYKSIVTGSPPLLRRLKKKRGSPDITHRSFCIAVRPSIASNFQVRPTFLGKGPNADSPSPEFPSQTQHLRNSLQTIDIPAPNGCPFCNCNYYLFYLSQGISLLLGWTARLHYEDRY